MLDRIIDEVGGHPAEKSLVSANQSFVGQLAGEHGLTQEAAALVELRADEVRDVDDTHSAALERLLDAGEPEQDFDQLDEAIECCRSARLSTFQIRGRQALELPSRHGERRPQLV
jgi:hypothetical protein